MVQSTLKFALCINNEDWDDLELRKVYRVLPDKAAAEDGNLRVIDESGEDYLYPQDCFIAVVLPQVAEEAFLMAA